MASNASDAANQHEPGCILGDDHDGRPCDGPTTAGTSAARVVHNKREPFDIYIGRPSKWGNPFSHKDGTLAEFKVATRDEAVSAYREWIKTQDDLLAALPELRGKVLGCWCKPLACHGDVLAELANA